MNMPDTPRAVGVAKDRRDVSRTRPARRWRGGEQGGERRIKVDRFDTLDTSHAARGMVTAKDGLQLDNARQQTWDGGGETARRATIKVDRFHTSRAKAKGKLVVDRCEGYPLSTGWKVKINMLATSSAADVGGGTTARRATIKVDRFDASRAKA